jgi:maleate cis-trans isomerase
MYDAYFMAGYDNKEYSLINIIRTNAELNVSMCGDYDASKRTFNYLYSKGLEVKNFTQYIPNNTDAHKLSGNIYELTKQGKDAYNSDAIVSSTFCKLKLQQIVRASEAAQKVIGSKPR